MQLPDKKLTLIEELGVLYEQSGMQPEHVFYYCGSITINHKKNDKRQTLRLPFFLKFLKHLFKL